MIRNQQPTTGGGYRKEPKVEEDVVPNLAGASRRNQKQVPEPIKEEKKPEEKKPAFEQKKPEEKRQPAFEQKKPAFEPNAFEELEIDDDFEFDDNKPKKDEDDFFGSKKKTPESSNPLSKGMNLEKGGFGGADQKKQLDPLPAVNKGLKPLGETKKQSYFDNIVDEVDDINKQLQESTGEDFGAKTLPKKTDPFKAAEPKIVEKPKEEEPKKSENDFDYLDEGFDDIGEEIDDMSSARNQDKKDDFLSDLNKPKKQLEPLGGAKKPADEDKFGSKSNKPGKLAPLGGGAAKQDFDDNDLLEELEELGGTTNFKAGK